METLTISGAYGRDYASKRAILEDWNAGKDFIVRTFGPDDGRYINMQDARGMRSINVRYARDRKLAILRCGADGAWCVK